MRHYILIALSFVAIAFLCSTAAFSQGRGKGKGGGRGRQSASARSFDRGQQRTRQVPINPAKTSAKALSFEKLTGRQNATNVQRWNEERKLAHHQATAEKLREISARNGNENLLQTADRLEQRAAVHYDKRMAKIDENFGPGESPIEDPVNSPISPSDADSFQTSAPSEGLPEDELSELGDSNAPDHWSNSVEQRVQNEERKLNHQLKVAQQVREIAAENGNSELLETASRMESMAADRYVKQLEKLGVFEESIPLPNTALLQPLVDAPPPPGT